MIYIVRYRDKIKPSKMHSWEAVYNRGFKMEEYINHKQAHDRATALCESFEVYLLPILEATKYEPPSPGSPILTEVHL